MDQPGTVVSLLEEAEWTDLCGVTLVAPSWLETATATPGRNRNCEGFARIREGRIVGGAEATYFHTCR